ncbi:hypothetical protein D3C73_1081910 [compost metagenome]
MTLATDPEPCIRRLGRPHAPSAAGLRGAPQLLDDCQGVGVTFIQLAHAQVMTGHSRQALEALQGASAAWQRQLVEPHFHQRAQALA